MYGRDLQFNPGTEYAYSNYGYLLLAAVVDAVTSQGDYDKYLQDELLEPERITEVGVISTLASGRKSDEAIAESPNLGLNALDPTSPLRVPSVYGGDGEINEIGVANAGLGASARALAQFAHLHAVWGNGGRAPGFTRTGSTPGASAVVWSTKHGVDAGLTINTRSWPLSSPTGELPLHVAVVADLYQTLESLLP
jgi:CubicO group peptidase (beta-lactamase class C family)